MADISYKVVCLKQAEAHPLTFPLLKPAAETFGRRLLFKWSVRTEAGGHYDSNGAWAELVPWLGFTFIL